MDGLREHVCTRLVDRRLKDPAGTRYNGLIRGQLGGASAQKGYLLRGLDLGEESPRIKIFCVQNMDLDSILEDVLRSRGQGNRTLKPRQKEALQSIVFFNWLREVVDLPNATITV